MTDYTEMLLDAAEEGDLEKLEIAYEKGGDIRAYDNHALRYSAYKGYFDCLKFCFKNGCDIRAKDDEALRLSAKYGRLACLEFCFKNGCDIRANNDYALRWSIRMGHKECEAFCRSKGSKLKGEEISMTDQIGIQKDVLTVISLIVLLRNIKSSNFGSIKTLDLQNLYYSYDYFNEKVAKIIDKRATSQKEIDFIDSEKEQIIYRLKKLICDSI